MTIAYHGTPITPAAQLARMYGEHFCVSFAHPDNAGVCEAIGASVLWDNGAFSAYTKGTQIDEVRKGDIVCVAHLYLMTVEKTSTRIDPRRVLRQRIETMDAKSVTIRELAEPQRDLSEMADRTAAIFAAAEMIIGGGRSKYSDENGGKSAGRPAKDWSEWRSVIEHEWDSVKHKTNKAAVAAMQAKGVPVRTVRQVWSIVEGWRGKGNGGSGR